jgi:hypothetical protein
MKSSEPKQRVLWIVLAATLATSILSVVFLRFGNAFRAVVAIPGVCAVCVAMFRLLQDEIAHERTIFRDELTHDRAALLQNAQNYFEVGVASHMAEVAFNKHVEFCEEYTAELHRSLGTLFRKGPSKETLQHVFNLAEIRRKWAVWTTPELGQQLDRFESAMNEIGVNAQYLEAVPGDPTSIKIMFARFAEVYGLARWEERPVPRELAITTAIEKLRDVLEINKLTRLRSSIIERASEGASV